MNSYSWVLWMVSAYLVTTAGDIMVKKEYIWLGAIIYASSTPFWVEVLRQKDLSQVAVSSTIIGNIIVLAGAHLFLGESLVGRQWIGLAVGVVAVMLMDV